MSQSAPCQTDGPHVAGVATFEDRLSVDQPVDDPRRVDGLSNRLAPQAGACHGR
jgi:hypothetical protein